MAEQNLKVTDGQNTWVVSASEYESMVANRPAYMPPLTVHDQKVEAVYENVDGESVRESLSPEQVARRASLGQSVVATPERIEQHRQEEVVRQKMAQADEADLTTFANAALPGSQIIQNLLVGTDAAVQARQELSTNMVANVGGNIAEMLLGAKGIGMGFKGLIGAERARKFSTLSGLSSAGQTVGKAGKIAGQIVAEETHFHVQQLLDRNQEFVAEAWAQDVGVGLLLGSPFIAGSAARAVGQAGRRAVEAHGGLGSMMSAAGDVMTTAAVLSPPGAVGTAMKARGAAAFHVSGRVMRKLFNKGKTGRALGATDEAAEWAARHADETRQADNFTPNKLDGMSPSKRRKAIDDFEVFADGNVDNLREIHYGTMVNRARKVGRTANGIRSQILGIHKKFKGKGQEVKMSQKAYANALSEANEVLKYAGEAGMEDVQGAIKRGILKGGTPSDLHRSFIDARINSRFRRGVNGGADVVDDAIKRFMEDETIWTAAQLKKNRAVNASIDATVETWDTLGDLEIPKHFEDIDVQDGVKLSNGSGAYAKLRENMEVMIENDLLTADQVRGIETKIVEAEAALVEGTEAYVDMIKINKARRATQGKLLKEVDGPMDIPSSQESFAATKQAMVMEKAQDMVELGGLTLDAILSQKTMKFGARGVVAIHNMLPREKYEAFAEIQAELPQLTGNPQYAQDRLASVLDRGAAYDPAGTDMAGAKMVNTLYYLAGEMPKSDDSIYGRQVPQPLSLVEEYLEKHVAAYDPVSVGYAVAEGRVTPGMVSAVRVTAPSTYAQMNLMYSEMLAKTPAKEANPRVVASIGLFMGGLDPLYDGNFISKLQSSYAQTPTQAGVIQGGPNNMPNPSQGSGNSEYTTSQRQQQ